jgi:hypothetical protein
VFKVVLEAAELAAYRSAFRRIWMPILSSSPEKIAACGSSYRDAVHVELPKAAIF